MSTFSQWYVIVNSGEDDSYIAISLTRDELLTIKYLIRTFDEYAYESDYAPCLDIVSGPYDTEQEALAHIREHNIWSTLFSKEGEQL